MNTFQQWLSGSSCLDPRIFILDPRILPSVQVLHGKPNLFLVALVPYFLFPHQVSLNANNLSKPIQSPQDFSLRFNLQTALYPSIAFPLLFCSEELLLAGSVCQ